ncbi:MAG: hypothetical protein ACRYFS_10340 [Janthinobacterium lividum]
MPAEPALASEPEGRLARDVNRYFEEYRRVLCTIHADAVEKMPLPLLVVLDDRFGAGYQLALIHAAQMLQELGTRK